MRKQHEHPTVFKDSKKCTNCHKIKLFSEFHKWATSLDGYKHFCKVCVKDYDQIRIDTFRKYPRKMQGDKMHCRWCEQYLDKSNFWSTNTYCRPCTKFLGRKRNIENQGMTIDQWVDLEKSQNGVCKICGEPERTKKRLSIDHDHSCCDKPFSCGKCIRGLLCFRCNRVLGQVRDDKTILQKMIDYL